MLDHEGHGHKAIIYKSHFPPLRHSVVQRHQQIHWLINHVYSKEPSLCSLCPHDRFEDQGLYQKMSYSKQTDMIQIMSRSRSQFKVIGKGANLCQS